MLKYDAAKAELLAKGFTLTRVPAVNPQWIRDKMRETEPTEEVSLYAEDS